jgi:Uma2 family endonuclease
MATATRLLTFEEFEQMPETPGKEELLEGELVELPSGDLRHDRIARRIFKELDAALAEAHKNGQAAELGEVCIEFGYKLASQNWVQPDVSVTNVNQVESKYLEGAPAIAVEVISPSNTVEEVELKIKLYFEHGAREVWRVHPKTQHVIVQVADQLRIVRDTLTTPLLPGLSMTVAEILG